ncbi:MAG: IgGFc-binding protein, partial [Paludibacteraceae bacterium]|nr:IgGFc-binding protein [Paludibacteraceae bacterium]
MFNYGNLQQDVNLKLYLYAVARKKTSFRIQYADGSYSRDIEVPANGRSEIFTVDQSKAYITDPDLVMSKGMHILSNDPISLYALNQNAEAGSYDATNVLPTKTLGREYVIQTYSTDGVATEFSILGTQNYTYVTIEYYEKNVETGEVTKGTVDLMLDKGETYLHRSSG